jgi:glycosyltransferase involved in cell wall biosynthesis
MNKKRPVLSIIRSTHASLEGFKKTGLLYREKKLFQEYSKYFDVFVYSSDSADYSKELGIVHVHNPRIPKSFGWHHLVYYLWLIWKSPKMKGIIKVFGSNIPTLPIVKLFSGNKLVVTYEWDYANTTRQNENSGLKHWLPPILERMGMLSADLIMVTTESLQDYVHQMYAKPTVLLPNWVDRSEIQGKGYVRDKDLILFAGRLVWSKGVDVLLDAFRKIKQEYPKMRLVICGDGEEREILKQKVTVEAIRDVEFTGVLPNTEVLNLMQRANYFVLPTVNTEGHPKVLIEAMACGAICIGSDIPGIRDIIKDKRTGVLVRPNDSNGLYLVIKQLIEDNNLCKQIRETVVKEVEKYDFKVVVQKEISELLSISVNKKI